MGTSGRHEEYIVGLVVDMGNISWGLLVDRRNIL